MGSKSFSSTSSSQSQNSSKRKIRLATNFAVAVACILIIVKLFAWYLSGSVVLLSSFIDSIMDAFASVINLFAVRHAMQPADTEHRFGHGKMEAVAGLAQAAFILGSGVFIFVEAVSRILNPVDLKMGSLAIGVMSFSMLLTAGLVVFQRHVSRKTGSLAIKADALHYTSDFLMNSGVIIALILVISLGWQLADPIAGMLVALIIVYSAINIARQSIDRLMDRELPDEDREKIRNIIISHSEVVNFHDLRTRSSGLDVFIQFHLEMDGALTLNEAHKFCDEVEASIIETYPNAKVIIHADPEGIAEGHQVFPT